MSKFVRLEMKARALALASVAIWKSGNENDREVMTLGNQFTSQLYPIHTRHLHVANQAIGVIQPVRFQERFGDANSSTAYPRHRIKLTVAGRSGSLSSTIAITGIDNLAFGVREF